MNRNTISVSLICMMLTASFVLVGMTAGKSNPKDNVGSVQQKPAPPVVGSFQQKPEEADPPGTINGAINPELVSDHVAWSIIFAAIAKQKTPEQKINIRGYIRQLGLGCAGCSKVHDAAVLSGDQARAEADIDKLILVAQEYDTESKALDSSAGFPLPASERASLSEQALMAKASALKQQKEHLVSTKVAHLSQRLTSKGYADLRSSLDIVKRGVKIVPYSSKMFGK
jgi:hypothetical protein